MHRLWLFRNYRIDAGAFDGPMEHLSDHLNGSGLLPECCGNCPLGGVWEVVEISKLYFPFQKQRRP